MRCRDAKVGLLGSGVVVLATLLLVKNVNLAVHPAVQFAMAFLLLHSLRWSDEEHQTKNALKLGTAIIWVFHAVLMVHSGLDHTLPIVYGTSGALLAISICAKVFRGTWKPIIVPIAALQVLLVHPLDVAADRLHSTPAGLIALIGSFLLFGVGTVLALTRSRWNAVAPVMIADNKTNQPR